MEGSLGLKPLAAAGEDLTKRLYTVPEIVRLTGMTRKQVMYLSEIGLVTPILRDPNVVTGRCAYFYSAAEGVKALIVAELRRSHLSPREVQQVAGNLQEHGLELSDSRAYLLTDGYSVYYAFSETEVVDIHKHHRQRLLLVPIHEQVAKLQEVAYPCSGQPC